MKIFLLLFLILVATFSCSSNPLKNLSRSVPILEIKNEKFSETQNIKIEEFFEIKYSLLNFNSPNLDQTKCDIQYEVRNISTISMYASFTIFFKSKGDFSAQGHIVGGKLKPNEIVSGKYSFKEIPCDYVGEIRFVY